MVDIRIECSVMFKENQINFIKNITLLIPFR